MIDSFQYLRFAARHVITYAALHTPRPRPSAHYLGTCSEVRSAAIGAHRLTLWAWDGWRIYVSGGGDYFSSELSEVKANSLMIY